jgi:hypothetical protein
MGSWESVVGEGRGCRRLIEAEAEATGAYLRRVCRLKEEGRQLKCQRKNRKNLNKGAYAGRGPHYFFIQGGGD